MGFRVRGTWKFGGLWHLGLVEDLYRVSKVSQAGSYMSLLIVLIRVAVYGLSPKP